MKSVKTSEVYKGQKANIDSYSAFFDNCKANDTGLTKQLEDAGVTDVYCLSADWGCQPVGREECDCLGITPRYPFIPFQMPVSPGQGPRFKHGSHSRGCGLVFDICVKSSALHGAEMGFRVSVPGPGDRCGWTTVVGADKELESIRGREA